MIESRWDWKGRVWDAVERVLTEQGGKKKDQPRRIKGLVPWRKSR